MISKLLSSVTPSTFWKNLPYFSTFTWVPLPHSAQHKQHHIPTLRLTWLVTRYFETCDNQFKDYPSPSLHHSPCPLTESYRFCCFYSTLELENGLTGEYFTNRSINRSVGFSSVWTFFQILRSSPSTSLFPTVSIVMKTFQSETPWTWLDMSKDNIM